MDELLEGDVSGCEYKFAQLLYQHSIRQMWLSLLLISSESLVLLPIGRWRHKRSLAWQGHPLPVKAFTFKINY
jgi:hypothetical protein